ncbi:hypothetical protein FHS20_004768 [Phyllobacterium endophyticum]|uniref:Uncharacterized protein n=1 Tax=Phyllobacterium endophyticum TaxID=1149773 RepID=A0A2P7B1G1_9HYPH|nr:hypothetical protein [Phyllobacterium endophyticum]PSH60300.1 hypothetical protein CU100_06325 [Phyllobacterium endophyticum]
MREVELRLDGMGDCRSQDAMIGEPQIGHAWKELLHRRCAWFDRFTMREVELGLDGMMIEMS